ncbi:unnamed protein product [Commensalibacter communis]|uniref:hypothetical protein n=1 Tax=Commensalibacter communis TaxID=2972786 RepID=UPI0022FF9BE1|nr:hypothetical protein [Commensalibacter communis]CAI3922310.1 unnamed protein product [Commensalibacter communis]CAI3937205.1 unnamed protein product [Commensalibacter communis]
MSSQLKVFTSAPGEAVIAVVGQAGHYGNKLTISFPQFSSIASQPVLQQAVEGNDLLLTIDADSLGDILEPDSPYQIKIPELECVATVIWPEIIARRGNSKGVINTTGASSKTTSIIEEKEEIQTQPEIQPEPIVQSEPVIEEEAPLLHEESKSSSSMPFIASIAAIFVIAGAGGAFWYIQHKKPQPEAKKEQVVKKEEPKKEQPKAPEVAKTQPPAAPKLEPSFAETLQKMSVPDVINKAPNTVLITKEGKRRLETKQYDDGVLLLENAASKGDVTAMLTLGLLYSPVNFKEGGAIPSPDMREAARYFQKAVEGGSKEAEAPRASLKEWLTKKADSGDDMARLTLKDFWK